MWALGDYAAVATEIIAGPRAGARRRHRDPRRASACSTSPPAPATSAIPAARTGARVDRHRPDPRAARPRPAQPPTPRGSALTWREARRRGTCPTRTASSTSVLSCVGVMFAPHHQASRRRAGPGRAARAARIGLLSWTPEGFIGQMFATMKPYAPPPPPGAQPPPLWGRRGPRARPARRPGHRRRGPPAQRCASTTSPTGEEFRDYFKTNYGPTIAVYRSNADDPRAHGRARPRPGRARPPGSTSAAASWSGSTCW